MPRLVPTPVYPLSISDDYASARHLLRQYEGWRGTARAIAGMALFIPIGAIPRVFLAFSGWVVQGKIGAWGVGLLSLLTGPPPTAPYRRRVGELPVRRSLDRHTGYDPR